MPTEDSVRSDRHRIEEPQRVVVVHYHEVGLKRDNRGRFELQLARNIRRALRGIADEWVQRISGRLLIPLKEEARFEEVAERLGHVFGIAYFAEARIAPQDMEKLKASAWELVRGTSFASFKVDTKRSQKSFPLTSLEINAEVGAFLKERSGAAVRLKDPDLTCTIEMADGRAFLYTDRVQGPGGLPVGVGEKAVGLLSAGIDSPVAAYKLMKRGVRVIFVHFHSYPYTNRASQRNVEQLVRVLTAYQFRSKLYLIPFIEIQKQIMIGAPAPCRVLLYRRNMVRMAEEIARREKAKVLVTGESIGQVASQTLSNIGVIDDAASMPILRPLAGDDKMEIIEFARRIGTYDLSIEPYEDCCSLFVPRHPETRADVEEIRAIEQALPLDSFIKEALEHAEIKVIQMESRPCGRGD